MIKYYGQFQNPKVDEFIHKEFFRNTTTGFYIECGAYDGHMDSSCKVFKELGWKGLNIEADPDIYNRLQNNRPGERNLNLALTSQQRSGKTLTFHTAHFNPNSAADLKFHGGKESGLGGLDTAIEIGKSIHPPAELKKIQDKNKDRFIQGTVKVTGKSYRDLILEQSITSVDLFVLDVEGEEENVIKGMQGSKVLPDVLCIEIMPTGLETLSSLLKPMGYRLYGTMHNNVHYVKE